MRGSTIVRRALEQARRAARAEAGLAPPMPGFSGIGRRALLKSMALAAGAAAMPLASCARSPARKVAIIGGGLAGLNALRVLAAAGVDATLYEGRRRLGGRVFTRTDFPLDGAWVEMGGQLVNSDHADMFALAKEYGLDLIDCLPLGGGDQMVVDRRLIAQDVLARALGPIAGQIAADSERLDADWEAAAPELDALSVTAYLDRHATLLSDATARRLLEQTIRTEFGAEPADSSALALIFNLPTVDGAAFEAIGASDERYVLRGGSQVVADALALANRERIETGRKLVALAKASDGGVLLQFNDGTSANADRVILSLPPGPLGAVDHGGLFPAEWQALNAELKLGANEKLNACYRTQPWAAGTMGVRGATWDLSDGARFAEVWNATRAQQLEGGVLTWFFGGDQVAGMGGEDLRATVESAVGSSMGDLSGAALDYAARTGWGGDPFTQGAYSNYRPGQITKFGGQFWLEEDGKAIQIARSGPVYFAGEHLSDAWPGYMNGAAQTGRMAAEAILAES